MKIYNIIKQNIKTGDAPRIAERAGKSSSSVRKIIVGQRTPQSWFYEAALQYLTDQKRLIIK